MIEIKAYKNEKGEVYFEATECGAVIEFDCNLETLLQKLSLITFQFEQELIDNI